MCDGCGCATVNDVDFSKLKHVIDEYGGIKGSLISILQKAQDIYGFLSMDIINYISAGTGVAPAKIFGVATFYTQFRLKPIGEYLIMLCKGTACHVNGAQLIEEAISEYLGISDGETTEDNKFTLNNVACLGCCSLAPVMMVKGPMGEEVYGNLTKGKVVKALEEIQSREAGGSKQ